MSVEVMRYGVDDEDPMHSHDVEEVYYIDSGSASINVEGDVTEISEGDVIHVRPGESHRFQDFDEELVVLGFYAPATND
jgi:mannose-6-phosphate isomerase-like protein (cupin superfamily)